MALDTEDVQNANCDQRLEGIKSLIKSYPDFPKPGILFR